MSQILKPKKNYKFEKWYFDKHIEIPKEWNVSELRQICKVRQGLQIPISDRFNESGKNRFQYITVTSIHSNEFNEFIEKPSKRVICTENDILFTRTGNTGEIVTDIEGVFHNNFFLIDFDRKKIIKNYLVKSLKQNKIQNMIHSLAGTTTIPDLNHGDFFRLKIIFPPLKEQQKIATILSNVDNLINFTQKIIDQTKLLKQGLMQKLLTKGIDHKKFKKIKWYFGKDVKIPEEWTPKSINEIGTIVTGSTPNTSDKEYFGDDYFWASPTDFQKEKYVKQTHSKLSKKGMEVSRKIPKDSILVVCIGSTIGKIVMSYQSMTTNQQINSIIGNKHNSHFIYYQLLYHNNLIRNRANQSAVPILNKSEFGKIIIHIPKKIKEQNKIASILSNIDSKIQSQVQYKEKLERLNKSLMQKLLTGEVRVKT